VSLATRTTTGTVKTDAEYLEEFDHLAVEEKADRSKLDRTILKMGALLVRWDPDQEMFDLLAEKYGYTVTTLKTRQNVAREIPEAHQHPELSYGAHVEAAKIRNRDARWALIREAGDAKMTVDDVRIAVRDRRVELGEIRPPAKRAVGYVKPDLSKLNWSGGFEISDGINVLKGRATLVNGEVQLTLDSTSPAVTEPRIVTISGGTKQIVEYTLDSTEADE
jgi:hypothetical protein